MVGTHLRQGWVINWGYDVSSHLQTKNQLRVRIHHALVDQ